MIVIKRASFLVTVLNNLTTSAYNEVIKPEALANIATTLHTTSDYLLGIERDEFDPPRIRRMIARNASSLTEADKREIINALFGEE